MGVTVSTLNPMVGIVFTISFNFNLYRIVVLPVSSYIYEEKKIINEFYGKEKKL